MSPAVSAILSLCNTTSDTNSAMLYCQQTSHSTHGQINVLLTVRVHDCHEFQRQLEVQLATVLLSDAESEQNIIIKIPFHSHHSVHSSSQLFLKLSIIIVIIIIIITTIHLALRAIATTRHVNLSFGRRKITNGRLVSSGSDKHSWCKAGHQHDASRGWRNILSCHTGYIFIHAQQNLYNKIPTCYRKQ